MHTLYSRLLEGQEVTSSRREFLKFLLIKAFFFFPLVKSLHVDGFNFEERAFGKKVFVYMRVSFGSTAQ